MGKKKELNRLYNDNLTKIYWKYLAVPRIHSIIVVVAVLF